MISPFIALGALALAAVIGHFIIPRLTDWLNLRRKNFKGELIPSAYGVQLAFYAVMGLSALRILHLSSPRIVLLYMLTIVGMAALGLVDDIWGSRNAGGFKGHFKKLLLEGKLTTGAVKALGGGALALAIGASISQGRLEWIINSLLIALSANALNLMDLRPGRALGLFGIGAAAAVIICWSQRATLWPLAALSLPALALAPADRRGQAMMGDTGSNALGSAVGLTFALHGGTAIKLVILAVLIALHVFCERCSISQTVERNGILKKIDSLLGVR